jgi:chitodextrinase
MSSQKQLAFFNKSGDSLNLNYNESTKLIEGNLLFDENSTDTFKTYALYTLEKVPSFTFEAGNNLGTNKFQLFNEYGFNFYGSKTNVSAQITKIEPVNNDAGFYSKWIYGIEFDTKFPKGSLLLFRESMMEFTNPNQSYVVISTKKNAVMIITSVDNSSFELMYYNYYSDLTNFSDKYIDSIDTIGVNNYINTEYQNKISTWSEPNFYDKIYVNKKLNVINSSINDGIYTVANSEITDIIHFSYLLNSYDLPENTNINIELILGTDLPKIYDGSLNISDNMLFVSSYPTILKSQQVFKIVGSINTNFLTVKDIVEFNNNNNITHYSLYDQVIYNNKIYECINSYTHSHASQDTMFITPNVDKTHWGKPTHIKVNETVNDEDLLYAQLYLTTNHFYYEYEWTESADITLASIADKYADEFKTFDIDLSFDSGLLKCNLIYPSQYSVVKYYHSSIEEVNLIGSMDKTFERLISTKEVLKDEKNSDISERYKYSIVFTDLDEFGIKVTINKMVYDIETEFIYTSGQIDMKRTIDKTLRNWLKENYLLLNKLGINVELRYSGNYTSYYYNSILVRTEYPNVPVVINEVLVGSTANSYIEHSSVVFSDLGPNLNIRINNRDYSVTTEISSLSTSTHSVPDIEATLFKWVDVYSIGLLDYGIIVSNVNNLLSFSIMQTENRLDYTINTSKIELPGIHDYIITDKIQGNLGVLIASNEIILFNAATGGTGSTGSSASYNPTDTYQHFENSGFSTGMVFSINNTYYTWVNQEFNVEYLEPNLMNLSYEGPFWDVNNLLCNVSPFVTIAFDSGFGQRDCDKLNRELSGEFDKQEFDAGMFNMEFTSNTYNTYEFDGVSNMVDIKYVQLSNSIYVLGDSMNVYNSVTRDFIKTINLVGNSNSIKMEYNSYNNYIYSLSKNFIFIINPLNNGVVKKFVLTSDAYDILINSVNGDVYVSYNSDNRVEIYDFNLTLKVTFGITSAGKMAYNDYERNVYVLSNSGVSYINAITRTLSGDYVISGIREFIYYEPINQNILVDVLDGGVNYLYSIGNNIVTPTDITASSDFSDIIYNNMTNELNISDSSNMFLRADVGYNITSQTDVNNFGYIALNQTDGSIYLSSTTNNVVIINPLLNTYRFNVQTAITTKIVYNPERKSMWTIQPSTSKVLEIEVVLSNKLTINGTHSDINKSDVEGDFAYGNLDPNYVESDYMWLKSRDFFRRPRENFNDDVHVKYYWKWFSDNVPEFFLYDYSGEQLALKENVFKQSASYSYIGETPLPTVVLNKEPNADVNRISDSIYQKTIFDKIEYTLSHIDDENDISSKAEPLQLFVGFQSKNEGALRSILQLYKKEEINVDIVSDTTQFVTLRTIEGSDRRAEINLSPNSIDLFTNMGLKSEQHIAIYLKDKTNKKNQYISHNNSSIFIIRDVYPRTIVLDFFDVETDILEDESTIVLDYPIQGSTTYLDLNIEVIDKEIGRFLTYGQTEEEDIRFKIELGNVGKLINTDDVFIFKQYDILEGGIDWTFLNKKRKEMMMMKNLIYPYIGSYKSIINAINFFGYNDLELNEYYKNVDASSANFGKLFKVEIPDIFDNSVEGWTENDFIKHTMPNENFEVTNLFNLTYYITDKEGTNVLTYSLDEVIIKLQGLKYWLKKNIIPLTHKILDITGRAYLNSGTYIQHKLSDVSILNIHDNMTPVSVKLNEAYLMPVNSGSTVYNCVLDFYSIIPGLGADKDPTGLKDVVLPYNGVIITPPDYFSVKVRTYKTYKEWDPFINYTIGDKVTYYDKLYESVINNNKVNTPRKYESVETWKADQLYVQSNIVEYKRDFFTLVSLSSTSSVGNPLVDYNYTTSNNLNTNWDKITEWKVIDLEPVQTINEFRLGNNLLPFNFTVDSNLDPYITIDVISDNGYGCVYNDKKNYEIRGIKDLANTGQQYDKIGPFVPIPPFIVNKPPGVFTITPSSSTTTSNLFTWSTSIDDIAVISYEIYRNGAIIGNVSATTNAFNDQGLSSDTEYLYFVKAVDGSGLKTQSNTITMKTLIPNQAPNPFVATAGARTTTSNAFTWTNTGDDVEVINYEVFRDGVSVALLGVTNTYTDYSLNTNTTYAYYVYAIDGGGLRTKSNTISMTTLIDNQAPNAFILTAGTTTLTSNSFTWTPSGDDIGIVSYEVYRNNTLINTVSPSFTAYNDTGLASATQYTYYIKAVDGGGLKTQSNVITMKTLTPNVAPNPFVLSPGSNTINSNSFTWTNTGDDVAVVGYEIYRNGVLVTTTAGTANSYNDSGLASSTTYTYYVKAVDGEGLKTQSNTISMLTSLPNQAPNAFTLTAGASTINSNAFTWTNTGDDIGVASYEIYRNGSLIGTTTGTGNAYNDAGLSSSTGYSYYVKAVDGAGLKTQSNTINMTTANQAPNAFNVTAGANTVNSNSFTWTNTGDDVGVASYEIYRNGAFIGSTNGTANSYTDSGLASSTAYSYYVKAVDGPGLKTQSNTINMTTANQAPNAFTVSPVSSTTTSNLFNWTNTGDDVGVTSYEVYRNGSLIATTAGTANSYNDSGLASSTSYSYYIKAVDGAGLKTQSNSTNMTTAAANQPPNPFTVSAGTSTLNSNIINWTNTGDDNGVAGYEIFRNGVLIGTRGSSGNTYTDTGLASGTAYSYYVKAFDTPGLRTQSNTISITTLAMTISNTSTGFERAEAYTFQAPCQPSGGIYTGGYWSPTNYIQAYSYNACDGDCYDEQLLAADPKCFRAIAGTTYNFGSVHNYPYTVVSNTNKITVGSIITPPNNAFSVITAPSTFTVLSLGVYYHVTINASYVVTNVVLR